MKLKKIKVVSKHKSIEANRAAWIEAIADYIESLP